MIIMAKFVKNYFSIYHEFSKYCLFGFVMCLLESIFIGIYYYLSIYFVDALHFDISTAGIIISFYGIGAILGGIIGGKLSDKWTPGIVTTYSLFIQAITYFSFTQTQSVGLLMINAFILGIASYGFITANHLFVLSHCTNGENQRLKGLGILSMASNLGLGLSALILGETLSIGFYRVFLITAFFVFILACFSAYYELTTRKQGNVLSFQQNQPQAKQDSDSIQSDFSIFLTVLACVFFIGMIVTQSGTTYTIYIKEMFPDYGLKAVTILFAINSFIVVIASAVVCELIKEYNKLMMVGLGGFLIGFGMFMLTFSHWFVIAIFSCLVYTFGEIIFFSVSQLLCYQCGMENQKGTSLGIYRVVYASSRVLGPISGSLIYAQFGGDKVWIISGFIGTACILFCTFLYASRFNIRESHA